MPSVIQLRAALQRHASPAKAKTLAAFFKTGPGQYTQGDQFLGITVPVQRVLARPFSALPLKDIAALLQSPIHEERLIALIILVGKFERAQGGARERIAHFYLKNLKRVNNWDLVDLTAHQILGAYVYEQGRQGINVLTRLARSKNLWERRAAMVSTFYFIRRKSAQEAFVVARVLFNDEHDLIHKAVGWMLRETGKRVSRGVLEKFLRRHYKNMPRTALRYAIEHFSRTRRQAYLRGKV
jgi:3-methyladenine DNA glycosylase AlkD